MALCKKLLLVCALIFLFLPISQNVFASEICDDTGFDDTLVCGKANSDEERAMMDIVGNVLNAIYGVVGILAVVFVVSGGIKYSTSQGDPGKVQSAKNTITYSVCGLAVTLLAFGITALILDAISGQENRTKVAVNNDSERGKVIAISSVDSAKLIKGQSFTIKASVIPDYADNKNVSFNSNDENIATVDANGKLLAKSVGATNVTISSPDGPQKNVAVTVVEGQPVTSIKLKPTKITIEKDKSTYITATVLPSSAVNKNLVWTSSNTSVATVTSAGQVKGLKVGETTIVATAVASGSKTVNASVKVKVVEKGNNPTNPSSDDSKTTGSMTNTNYSKKLKMRKETRDIVNDHRKDFYYTNYKEEIKKRGGYTKYVKKLGGVFEEYATTDRVKVKTAADVQAVAEYVWGLWTIWGPDYGNGATHHNWRLDKEWKGGKNDGFYHNQSGRTSLLDSSDGSVDDVLSRSTLVRTNCNYAINSFYKKTKLKSIRGSSYHPWHLDMSLAGKITKVNKLEVGDIIHFFNSGGGWHHVAMVGEVYKDYVVIYDGGGRFVKSGNYKKLTKRTNSSKMTDDYSGEHNWWAFRPWKIDQSVTLNGIN